MKTESIKTYGHVLGVGLGTELANKRGAGGLDPVKDGLVLELAIVNGLLLVKVLVENDGGLLDALSLGKSSVVGGTEEEVVTLGFSERAEALVGGLVVGGNVANDNDLVKGLEFLQVLLGHGGDGGHGLLGHV